VSELIWWTETFWTNPQYRVTVVDPDDDDEDNTGTLIVGLMMTDRRHDAGVINIVLFPICYSIYEVSYCILSSTLSPIRKSSKKNPRF